jgi:hypothetical protein
MSLTVAMCSACNAVSTFSGKTKRSGRLHVLLMFIFSLFLTLERSSVEVVIRLLGCRLLCKVFALYALHTDASHSCATVCTWLRIRITLRFSFQHVHQKQNLDSCAGSDGHATVNKDLREGFVQLML